MNVRRRRILRLVGIGAAMLALPKGAVAFDPDPKAQLQLAMGPTSAAQKPGGSTVPASPGPTFTPCMHYDRTCSVPRHHSRRRPRGYGVLTR
jgi:hypothetical protein